MSRDLLLVRRIKRPGKTEGGIFYPVEYELDEDQACFFDVLEVGSRVKGIKAGDRIITQKRTGGQPFYFNGEDLEVIRDKYAWGIME